MYRKHTSDFLEIEVLKVAVKVRFNLISPEPIFYFTWHFIHGFETLFRTFHKQLNAIYMVNMINYFFLTNSDNIFEFSPIGPNSSNYYLGDMTINTFYWIHKGYKIWWKSVQTFVMHNTAKMTDDGHHSKTTIPASWNGHTCDNLNSINHIECSFYKEWKNLIAYNENVDMYFCFSRNNLVCIQNSNSITI